MATFVAFLTFISQYSTLLTREEEDCTFTRKTRYIQESFDLFDCSSLKEFYFSKHLITICVLDVAIETTRTTLINLQKVLDYMRDRFVGGLFSCTINNLEDTR